MFFVIFCDMKDKLFARHWTCRKLQSVASQRRAELLHHHHAVFVECPLQQGDDSNTCRESELRLLLRQPNRNQGSQQRRSPSASVLACLVVLLAVSQTLVG